MKYLYVICLTTILSSCGYIDSKEILKSILDIDDLSDYQYEVLFVKNTYSDCFYTIYGKIDIDSTSFQALKDNKFDNCASLFKASPYSFESMHVSGNLYSSFSNEDVPKWFDIQNKEIDIWAFYDTDSLTISQCNEGYNSWVLLKYEDGSCYIILDSKSRYIVGDKSLIIHSKD